MSVERRQLPFSVDGGDVLAGVIAGPPAQGMAAREAMLAGVWLHGHTATEVGLGVIAQDLVPVLSGVLATARRSVLREEMQPKRICGRHLYSRL
jgi:hypothetical protein